MAKKANIRISYNWDPTTDGPPSCDSQAFTVLLGNQNNCRITKITGFGTLNFVNLAPTITMDATQTAVAYWASVDTAGNASYSGAKTVTNYTNRLFVTPINNNDVNAILGTRQEITIVFFPWKSVGLSNSAFYSNIEASTGITLEFIVSFEYEDL